jgi:hypothetical protein
MAYIFQQLAKTGSVAGFNTPRTSVAREWFRNAAENIASVSPNKLMSTGGENLQSGVSIEDIGSMFMFFYDPKLKDKLPFYDTFPLVIPIELYSNGFLGLNLHYLPPMGRASLMDALYTTKNNSKYDKTTRLKVTYGLLKKASRFAGYEQCVKRYLFGHVGSNFLYVDPSNWDMAIMLPTERFKKARKDQVWNS